MFDFKTLPVDPNKIPTTLVVGDLGLNFATSLKQIETDAKEGKADVVLHLGDIAYDLYIGGGAVGLRRSFSFLVVSMMLLTSGPQAGRC